MIKFESIKELDRKTIYKEKLYKQIKFIIKKPENFNKNGPKRKYLINEKLKSLTILNDFTNVFNEENLELKGLKEESIIFKEKIEREIQREVERVDSAGLNNRIRQCIKIVIDNLIQKGYIEKFEINTVIEKIDINRLFHMCLSVIVSCIDHVGHNDDDSFDSRKRDDVVLIKFLFRLQSALYLYIASIIVENNIQMTEILKEIYDEHRITVLSDSTFYEFTNQISELFLFSLGIHENIRSIPVTDDQGRFKTMNIVSLPSKISSEIISAPHIPQIVEPEVDYENIGEYLLYNKRIKDGVSKIDLSKKARESLVISQKKKFKINKKAIELFKYLDSLPYDKIKHLKCLPFVPLSVFPKLEYEIKECRKIISQEKIDAYIEAVKEYNEKQKKKKGKNKKRNIELKSRGIEPNEAILISKIYLLEEEYKQKVKLRRMHNTIIKFAELFENFPIFFVNSFDYRGRMYPWHFMFNRTSGIYKYLLIEFSKEPLKNEHVTFMEKVFCESVGIQKFELNVDEIISNHRKKFFYYVLFGFEIERILKSNKPATDFLMEIDQKSSSSVLMGIILGDISLALDSNLIGPAKIDPPTKLMKNSHIYFKDMINEESLKEMMNSRDLHKYLMMCLNYNQTEWGRKATTREYITNVEDADIIAKNYNDYVDSIYPNLTKKKNKFNNIIRYYLKKCGDRLRPIVIDLPDECRCEWGIFQKRNKEEYNVKKKYKSPLKNEFVSYHYEQFETNKVNRRKLGSSFLPSLIHSLDGSLMRLIIFSVYNKCKHIINHLHDSIQFNPKYYKEVLKSIEDVYINAKLHSFLDQGLFNNLETRITSKPCREKFINLINDLRIENFKDIIVNRKSFSAKSMFPPE